MSSNLTSLRLRLKSTLPSFQSLTLADLQDLKWSLRQIIFSEIFRESRLLEDSSDQLQNLAEKREKQLAKWKATGQQSVSKEEKLEFERDYRTSFMTEVLKGLEITKWPPTLVPFANPMDDLLHNKETVLDAMNHLLNILFPSSQPPTAPSKRTTPTKHSLPTSPISSHDNYGENNDNLLHNSQDSPPPPGSIKNTPRQSSAASERHSIRDTPSSSVARKYDGKIEVGYPSSVNNTPLPSSRNTADTKLDNNIPNLSFGSLHGSESDSSSQHSYFVSEDAVKIEDKKLVEHLLYQNQILTTQLQHLKQSITKRNQVETTLSALLQDINKCLLEIVDVGVNTSSVTSTTAPVIAGKTCSECGQSVSKADTSFSAPGTSTLPPNTARSTMSTTSTSSRMGHASNISHNTHSGSAAFSWRNVATRLKQLETQWTDATRAAKQLATSGHIAASSSGGSSSSHHSHDFFDGSFGNSTKRMSSGMGSARSALSSAASRDHNHNSSSSSGMLTGRSTSSNTSNFTYNQHNHHHQQQGHLGSGQGTMAEKAKRWISSAATGHYTNHLQHQPSSHTTDMLQRECLVLLTALETYQALVSEEQELTSSASTQNTQTTQNQRRRQQLWLERFEQQTILQQSMQQVMQLLVSTANSSSHDGGDGDGSNGGVMLATHSMMQDISSKESQQSALAQLIQKVEEEVYPRMKKSVSLLQLWTGLCDTAMCEHVLLARQALQQRTSQQHWRKFLYQLVDKLLLYGRSAKKALEESCAKINTYSRMLQEIFKQYTLAEEARITQKIILSGTISTSGKSGAMKKNSNTSSMVDGDTVISPMDALCRGVAGDEVAHFLTVVRQYHTTFTELDDSLQELVTRFTKTMTWEQNGLMAFLKASVGQDVLSSVTSTSSVGALSSTNGSRKVKRNDVSTKATVSRKSETAPGSKPTKRQSQSYSATEYSTRNGIAEEGEDDDSDDEEGGGRDNIDYSNKYGEEDTSSGNNLNSSSNNVLQPKQMARGGRRPRAVVGK